MAKKDKKQEAEVQTHAEEEIQKFVETEGLEENVSLSEPFDDVGDPFWDDDDAGWEAGSAVIWQPEIGSLIMGIYDGNEPFTEGDPDKGNALKHYIIERGTKTRYSFVGGQVFDKNMLQAEIVLGYAVKIKYLGQKDTKESKRVNLFDIKFRRV